jgi:hypothetical protein
MRPGVFVNVEAGQEWREPRASGPGLVWLVAPDLARAAPNEADQADVLGVPRAGPRSAAGDGLARRLGRPPPVAALHDEGAVPGRFVVSGRPPRSSCLPGTFRARLPTLDHLSRPVSDWPTAL